METVTIDMSKSTGADGKQLGARVRSMINGNLSQMNTWCTYGVSNSGVYTLDEVADATGTTAPVAKGTGQFAQDVNTNYDTNPSLKEINTKRTSLRSSNKNPGANSFSGGTFVYGNDKTVYINVELKNVQVDDEKGTANGYRQIVDKVDSTVVGVANANLEIVNRTDRNANTEVDITPANSIYIAPVAEIYTLYKDGKVLAAVTIGNDNGSTATWAYIISDKSSHEDFEHANTGMKEGQWYEVKTNADGEVRSVQLLKNALAPKGRRSDDATKVEFQLNEYDRSVVLHDDHKTFDKANWIADKDSLIFKDGTLWTNTDETKGFHVSDNVKVVIAQAELKRGYGEGYHGLRDTAAIDEFATISDVYEGHSGLEQALRDLDENFVGDLSAVLNAEGNATVIIFNDCWGTYINEGDIKDDTPAVTGNYTLTLKGADLAGDHATNCASLVSYYITENGKTVLKTVTGTRGNTPGADSFLFEIPKAATSVYVENSAIVLSGDVTYNVKDAGRNDITVNAYKGSQRGYLQFSMLDDLTLDTVPDNQDQLYAIHFEDGTKGVKLWGAETYQDANDGNKRKTRFVVREADGKSADGNTWYVKDRDNIQYIQVTTGENSYAYGTPKDGNGNVPNVLGEDTIFIAQSKNPDGTGAKDNVIDLDNAMTGDIYVVGAEKVILSGAADTVVLPARLGWGVVDSTPNTDQNYYVRVNTMWGIDLTGNRAGTIPAISGVIQNVKTETDKIGEDISSGFRVAAGKGGANGIKPLQAVKVTKDAGITAKFGDEEITDVKNCVVKGQTINTIQIAASAGTGVLNTADGTVSAATSIHDDTAGNASLIASADVELTAAVKVGFKSGEHSKVSTAQYVGTKSTPTLNDGSNHEGAYVPVGSTVRITVTTPASHTLSFTTGKAGLNLSVEAGVYDFELGTNDVEYTIAG